MPYPSMLTKTWNDHISATNHPIETSQRTDLITGYDRQTVLDCGAFDPYATIWPMIENGLVALFWRTRKPKINVRFQQTPMHLYNAFRRISSPSLSLPECSWPILRLWQDRSQPRITQNRLLIEYPKNSSFRPDKWAPAPLRDWQTRDEVRFGTACCIQVGHVLVCICSHGTFLLVNHAFWFAHGSPIKAVQLLKNELDHPLVSTPLSLCEMVWKQFYLEIRWFAIEW